MEAAAAVSFFLIFYILWESLPKGSTAFVILVNNRTILIRPEHFYAIPLQIPNYVSMRVPVAVILSN
jgi:hypothetical protein